MKTATRYSRQLMLPNFGELGQRKLANAKVLIVGLGGLGAPVATYLTGAGVGTIGLCDPDVVSLSNLQRQILYTTSEIGESKIRKALHRLAAQNPEVTFNLHPTGLTKENAYDIVSAYDLVMDCTDNFATRYLIDDVCAKAGIPWIHGAIGEFSGEVCVMNYGCNPRRFTDIYPDRDEMLAMPKLTFGVLGAVPGVVGSIQANEAVKLIVGLGNLLAGRLLSIDLLTLQFQTIDL